MDEKTDPASLHSSESGLESRRTRLEEARFQGFFTPDDFAFCRGVSVDAIRARMQRGTIRRIRKPGVRGLVIPFSEWDREEDCTSKPKVKPTTPPARIPKSKRRDDNGTGSQKAEMIRYF
jgi:hypothetical protein